MKAKPLTRRTERRDDGSAIHLVIWELDAPLEPCRHPYKYRLAYVVDGVCVVRYDNERGKGDHRHVGEREETYEFSTPRQLVADFMNDVKEWTR
ncbi:hypothetical protein B447_17491 [Thauera sp. 27]|uniref:toxin-antitoxin system TumE family protein n=1 Tax=Thauera sp. 27 TaxID=305700 RepID=UPI0002D09FA8|nr:DUF6516 family protein [Thauera sp. 27]ENO76560.1 hypothetical protein B447_17491 [Thauera sp. 27]TXH45808.1 MAG: hypothetical protein E6Q92_02920 [Burkholderiaceae bacterium]